MIPDAPGFRTTAASGPSFGFAALRSRDQAGSRAPHRPAASTSKISPLLFINAISMPAVAQRGARRVASLNVESVYGTAATWRPRDGTVISMPTVSQAPMDVGLAAPVASLVTPSEQTIELHQD